MFAEVAQEERVVVYNTGAAQKYVEILPADAPNLGRPGPDELGSAELAERILGNG